MNTLALLTLAVLLLLVLVWAILSWRKSEARLQQLDQRVRQQGELIDAMHAALDNPRLSEEEQLAQSQRLVEKLKATRH
jgi:uncharacterized coiled-coil protein SlyX